MNEQTQRLELLLELQKLQQSHGRKNRTPTTEAATTLANLGAWLDAHESKLSKCESATSLGKHFIAAVFTAPDVERLADKCVKALNAGGTFDGREVVLAAGYCALAAMILEKSSRVHEAWTFAMDARAFQVLAIHGYDADATALRMRGLLGANARLARDPKQAAKAEAFKLWQDWQAGRARHKSGAAFARHVIEACPAIESSKVVERWVTQWRKDAKAKK